MTTTSETGGNGHSLTVEDKKALWTAFDEAKENLAMAESEVIVQKSNVSDAIKAIMAATGKNAFMRNGQPIRFAKRKGREVYYVRGGNDDLEEVDG
jgi:hypothetical protein